MTTDFMLTLAKLLEHCPKCHKTTLNEFSRLDISSSKMSRTCQCGYSIEINIKENIINPEEQRKILLENIENAKVEPTIVNHPDAVNIETTQVNQINNNQRLKIGHEALIPETNLNQENIENNLKQTIKIPEPPAVTIESKSNDKETVQKLQQLGKEYVNNFNNSNIKKDFSFKNFNKHNDNRR